MTEAGQEPARTATTREAADEGKFEMYDYVAKARQNRIDALEKMERSRANVFHDSCEYGHDRRHSVLAALARVKLRIATPVVVRGAGIAA